MRTGIACLLLLAALYPAKAGARATIVTQLAGRGWSDSTPTAPVGGNAARTLGEQRRRALQYAASLWEARLESPVPIVFSVQFDDLKCSGTSAILGGAAPTAAHSNLSAEGAKNVDPQLWYVSALADSLVGHDLRPGEPDIEMRLNASVDTTCREATGGFYYGLDGKAGDQSDFVEVVMHELGHGLGITSLFDPATGAWAMSEGADSYSAHVRDLDLDATWPQLTDAQRTRSATNVRRVVWDGPEARRLVPMLFAAGEPSLELRPSVAGYSGFIADSDMGKLPSAGRVSGSLFIAASCGAESLPAGQVVLIPRNTCKLSALLPTLSKASIAGLLFESPTGVDAPAFPIDIDGRFGQLSIPVLSLSRDDTAQITGAARSSSLQVTITSDQARRIGADDKQRPLLFVTDPYSQGSSISHLEQLVRPSQLMEPVASTPTHDLTFTLALLKDVGWNIPCGNGKLDEGEECDEGGNNSDSAGRCRPDCRNPRCGDGIKDKSEECDDGDNNDDARPDACRKNCKRSSCGDGVLDRQESCDRGALNSDSQSNACRKSCKTPYCGDGVLDALEQCDDGKDNSDTSAGACRMDCRAPRCGDNVVDESEECDQGRNNGDAPDACRVDCRKARCGDGILDTDESCDSSADCTPSCTRVADEPDAGQPPGTASTPAPSGCGCRVQSARSRHDGVVGLSFSLGILSVWRSRRRRQLQGVVPSGAKR